MAEVVDGDFRYLIHHLELEEDAVEKMQAIAIEADTIRGQFADDADLERQKKEAIALAQRRLDANVHLYADSQIERVEYLRRGEALECEIVHWDARPSETAKMDLELAMCVDLDQRHIVAFQLKSLVTTYLILKTALEHAVLPRNTKTSIL